METELSSLSIMCLLGVLKAKVETLLALCEELTSCLTAPCPPGEPGEVIAGQEGEVQVTAPAEPGFTAGAITPKAVAVKGVRL